VKTNLAGSVALVTGGARGIGAAIAEALTANGARVAVADIDGAGAAAMAARLPGAIGYAMDVREPAQVQQAVAAMLAAFGRIDILVNNAGVNTLAHRVDIDAFPEAEWHRITGVDLDGVFQVSRHVVPHLRAGGGGRIVNIASVVGLVPLRLQSAFAAAKAGVINLTKAMALELGPAGIRVNGIAPGSVLTEVTRQLFYAEDGSFHARVARLMQHIPLGRPGMPQEIANAALFLASEDSACVHGHILTVDGGWTAGFMI
jgi:NAD(P)-dependent dehydrogenase (short-subunit alcohol dehydrogenase family)